MTALQRLEAALPDAMEALAAARVPDYLEDVLAAIETTPQRRSATRRGLGWAVHPPTVQVRSRMAAMSWRLVAVVLAVLLTLIAASILAPAEPRWPPAFSSASPADDVHSVDGDLMVLAADRMTTLVPGPAWDTAPTWAADRSVIAFVRRSSAVEDDGVVYVVGADGSGLRRLTTEAYPGIERVTVSPDGSWVVFVVVEDGRERLGVVAGDGSSERLLPADLVATTGGFIPDTVFRVADAFVPTGSGGLVAYREPPGDVGTVIRDGSAIVVIDLASGRADAIATAGSESRLSDVQVSPDGQSVAYTSIDRTAGRAKVHVTTIDGATDRVPGLSLGWPWLARPVWAPDGGRLLVEGRPTGASVADLRPVVLPVGDGGPSFEIASEIGLDAWTREWSTDGRYVLASRIEGTGVATKLELWDTVTGSVTPIEGHDAATASFGPTAP